MPNQDREMDEKWAAWREEGDRLAEEAGPEYHQSDEEPDANAYLNVALWAGIAGAL